MPNHYLTTKAFPMTYLRKTKSFKRKKLDRRLPRIEDLLFDFGGVLFDASGSTAKVTEALGCDSSFSSDILGIFWYYSLSISSFFWTTLSSVESMDVTAVIIILCPSSDHWNPFPCCMLFFWSGGSFYFDEWYRAYVRTFLWKLSRSLLLVVSKLFPSQCTALLSLILFACASCS